MQLPPPSNWQDFQLLCWDLWKTIWKDPGASMNGRSGQIQYGVDIWGRPNRGQDWVGIQCKGKENFTGQQLTKKEIETEVQKAINFIPLLSDFIIATTAPRDVKIQHTIRVITNDNKAKGLFSVSVFSWNDIEDLILTFNPPLAQKVYPYLSDEPANSMILDAIAELGDRFSNIFSNTFSTQIGNRYDTSLISPLGILNAKEYKNILSTSDVLVIHEQINTNLTLWNYNIAFSYAEKLEQLWLSERIEKGLIELKVLLLLARIHVINAEINEIKDNKHIERAKYFISKIEMHEDYSSDTNIQADCEALKGAILNIEMGPEIALKHLATLTNPYAIRIRLSILFYQQKLDEAIDLIKISILNEQWCDKAVVIYASKNLSSDVEAILNWVSKQVNKYKYKQCIVQTANVYFNHFLSIYEKGDHIKPDEITDKDKTDLSNILIIMQAVLDDIVKQKSITSELCSVAVKIAWSINHLLGNRKMVSLLSNILYTIKPLPLEVAKSVISGYMDPPSDIYDRLCREHPGDFEANILASVIQSSFFNKHKESFSLAKELLPLADTSEKRKMVFTLLQHLYQTLDGDDAEECDSISETIVASIPKLKVIFDANKALRNSDPDTALKLLDNQIQENDAYWLQIRANAFIQKKQPGDAVDCLLIVAKSTLDPVLLHKTAVLASQAGKIEISVQCFEKILELYPSDETIHSKLASIYINKFIDIEKAAEHLNILHINDPNNIEYTTELAMCYAHLFKPDESLMLFNEACKQKSPGLRAILGRAELQMSLGNTRKALTDLIEYNSEYSKDPSYLGTLMNIAFAAGDEVTANNALYTLKEIKDTNAINSNILKILPVDEMYKIFKTGMSDSQKKTKYIHELMLKGQMPWVWAEQVSGFAIYLGWRRRTQELSWIGDDPINRASHCIYSTNAFHPLKTDQGIYFLKQPECPPKGAEVVLDISALITLHRLDLIDTVIDYFGNVIIPAGYLPSILEDGKKMGINQLSQLKFAECLNQLVNKSTIVIRDVQETNKMIIVDEYNVSEEHRYHIIDIILPIYAEGIISNELYNKIEMKNLKSSNVDGAHLTLTRSQDIIIELSTLSTLYHMGILDTVTHYYNVNISKINYNEIVHLLERFRITDEIREIHYDLWGKLRNNPHVNFIPHAISDALDQGKIMPKDRVAFLGWLLARDKGLPLMADDRACQMLTFNTRSDISHAAFGSDVFISTLADSGVLTKLQAADMYCQMIKWRYKFLLPSADILKEIALQYCTNPPGHILQEIAEYVHDCMQDIGLFSGLERTSNPESMALRLYMSWVTVISNMLISIWGDDSFSLESANKITEWCIKVFLPSPPVTISGILKVNISALTPRMLIAHMLIYSNALPKGERIPEAMKSVKTHLSLSDDEYNRIVSDTLHVAQQSI